MSSNQFVGLSFPSSSNSNSTTTPSIHSFYSKSTSTSTLQNPTNTTFLELDVCSLAKMYQQPPKQSHKMASELEKLITAIQKNIPNGELKTNIISNFQNLCGQIQNLNVQIQTLTHEKICDQNNYLKQINALSDKVMALQEQLLQQKTYFEMPHSDSVNQPPAHMDTSSPSPNIPPEPKLINQSITGVVKFFNIEKKYGFINFTENENGTETLKDAFIHATNISKSKIGKPEERNLQPNETVVFDLYQIRNNKYVAKNVTGPNGENVQGVYVVYQKQNTRMPNQRQHQPNYRNQPYPKSQSRPRSHSIRRNQLNDYQQFGRNIFRSQRHH